MNNNACISQRALREIYLKPFEIAVKESQPWTVMTSFNYLNGTYTSENRELLQTILRDEWGFKGTVMTDWFGGSNGAKQIAAGNDMLQPGRDQQYNDIVNSIKNKTLPEADLDTCVSRIIKLIEKTPRYKGYKATNKPDLKAHAAITRQSATEGMVLLKNNESALPLAKDVKNVALFGCTSYNFIAGGTGSGNVNHAYVVSLVDGLKNANMTIDADLAATYNKHIKEQQETLAHANEGKPFAHFLPTPLPEEITFEGDMLKAKAESTDAAIITIGRLSGEFMDRKTTDFNLTFNEHKLIADVCKAYHAAGKKVIVLLNIGGVIETASWKEQPDAILCAWQAGLEGGNSVADVLTGKASPSGKLTMTWPLGYEDNASSNNFPINQEPDLNSADHGTLKHVRKDYDYTNYEEDVFVGYRYFSSFNKPVSYPFGYGLSYTTFAYSDAAITQKGDTYEVSVKVTNTGKAEGKEVVQLYYNDPESKQRNKPEIELKAYAKTKALKPGESETLKLTVNTYDLASFDDSASIWLVNGVRGNFLIGAASNDIRATVTADVRATSRKVANVLRPQQPMKLLHR